MNQEQGFSVHRIISGVMQEQLNKGKVPESLEKYYVDRIGELRRIADSINLGDVAAEAEDHLNYIEHTSKQ